MPFTITIQAAGAFQKEIECNAAMCALPATTLVGLAPTTMAVLGHRLAAWPDGKIAIESGSTIAGLVTEANIEAYRKASGIRAYEGISSGDLGGSPYGDFRTTVVMSDRLLLKAEELFGTRGASETCGFLVWSFLRLLNSVREDYPGGTIGVASPREGTFIPVFGPNPNQMATEWVFFRKPSTEIR